MQAGIDNIASLVRNLDITDNAPQDQDQGQNLRNAVHVLIRSANTVTSQAQSVKSLAGDANSSRKLPITDVCSLCEGIKKLANITIDLQGTIDALNEAAEHSVVLHLSDQDVLWKVAEECFNQTVNPCGTLDAEDYFAPLKEACLEWPYDPDFESEEYYEHENRLDVDEDYTAAFQQ
ncbi:uncharacterized protein PV09_09489 [Verruconis gallopava]|uniref:Uncharacterized protein n=1 Tax=Verruconis gallopava TaxID=253628 RepID=A0A0D1YDE6_9PEZI|nr:uncharacterized protein PV09_09489 [Verruconis gallopava]KIV98761.1 hypothetical protein PV09_09489 [Verruconis gallopava]